MNVLSIIMIISAAIWFGQLSTNDSCDVEIAFEFIYIYVLLIFKPSVTICFLRTECICVFPVILIRTNSDYVCIQH